MADNTVEEWIITLRMAIRDDSPFKGMVDLTGIFDLPLDVQWQVFDALTAEEKDSLAQLYGPKGADA